MSLPLTKNRMNAVQRRAGIVETAVDLFSRRGFQGTTTRELAAAVGVSEPVLYQHFDDKRALYAAILESKCGKQDEIAIRELEIARQSGDIRAFFTKIAELVLDWYVSDPRYARLMMFSRLEDHELADLFYEQRVAVFYDYLTNYLSEAMAQGRIRASDPTLTARAFVGMVSHQGVIYAIYQPGSLPGGPPAVVKLVVDIFLNGIIP